MERTDRYVVKILPRAEKDLRRLRQHQAQAIREILKLEEDYQLGHTLTGSLRGSRALEFNLKGEAHIEPSTRCWTTTGSASSSWSGHTRISTRKPNGSGPQ